MGTTARDLMERDAPEEAKVQADGEEGREEDGPKRSSRRPARGEREAGGRPQRCRICARRLPGDAAAASIFAEAGRRHDLQRSIQKYLSITVSYTDRLPKMVCTRCIGKLDDIHSFATMALKSQEILKQELSRISTDLTITVDSSDSTDSSINKLSDRGLLHSILTKGYTDAPNHEEPFQRRQKNPSTEEMEVKVDPMLFLQCTLEESSSTVYSDFSDDSDGEISSYCSPTSQPLSLPNKSNDIPKKSNSVVAEISKIRDDNDNEDLQIIDERKNNKTNEEVEFEERMGLSNAKLKFHVCKICAKAFVSQIALQNHLWSHLPTGSNDVNDTQRVCDDVNGVISQDDSCTENMSFSDHFICPICNKKISTKGNLKVHLETHRPKGMYGCDICGRIFKTELNLFRHKDYHNGTQFPCSICGRVYPTNSTLRAHSITHSDERPHACPLCVKTFKRNQDLKFHINQHTGARPYQCPYCPKAFASSGNCFSHRKRMHPKEVHRDRQRAADLMR